MTVKLIMIICNNNKLPKSIGFQMVTKLACFYVEFCAFTKEIHIGIIHRH